MKRRKQKGVYECELIRFPDPVEGEPPFFLVVLLTTNEDGFLLPPSLSTGPMCDPDAMLKDLIKSLNGAYPKAIKVRTEETKALLEAEGFSDIIVRKDAFGNDRMVKGSPLQTSPRGGFL